MKIGKAIPFAGAIALLLGSAVGSAEAQEPIDNLLVQARPVCAIPGTVVLTWRVVNPKENGRVIIKSATVSGVYEGDVSFDPNPLPAGAQATGDDGPVPGDTKGKVTLTVDYVTAAGVVGQSKVSVDLSGQCRASDDNDGSARGDEH